MAGVVVDELITKLEYVYDAAAIKNAEQAVKKLEHQNKLAAATTDNLADRQTNLKKRSIELARGMADYASLIEKSRDRTAALERQQRALAEQIKRTGGANAAERHELQSLNTALAQSRANTSRLQRDSSDLAKEQRKISIESRTLSQAQTEVSKTARKAAADQKLLANALRQTRKEGDRNTRWAEAANRAAGRSLAAQRGRTEASRARLAAAQADAAPTLGDAAGRVQGLAGGAAATLAAPVAVLGATVTGVGLLGAKVIEVGTNFESLRARLKTVEGSSEGAARAFSLIQKFTASTPYQLEEVTTAFVRLKSLGLDASESSLSAFGNLAAAQGKSIIEFIEAVADASTGEFERLKEFGIKASSQGDKVAFTFKGATTTVGKNAEEIQAFLKGLGETEFAGAMADQMATTAGALSNLQDTVAVFFDQVAQLGVLDEFKGLLGDISGLAGDQGLAKVVADVLVEALQGLRSAIANVTAEDIKAFFEGVQGAVTFVVTALNAALDAFRWLTEYMDGSTADALEVVALGLGAIVLALTGPAGIVIAAGLAGAAIGEMIAELMFGLDEVERRRAKLQQDQEKDLQDREDAHDEHVSEIEARAAAAEKDRQERLGKAEKIVEKTFGGLGEGLAKGGAMQSETDPLFYAAKIQQGGKQAEIAREALLTQEGRVVVDALYKHESSRIAKAEQKARQDARKRGADEEAAATAAREAVRSSNESTRRKALETAQATFEQTGSAEAAARAAVATSGKVKGAKVAKGKKGKSENLLTEDIEKQIEKLSKEAGKRSAARAAVGGERSQSRLDEIERAERKAVQERLTSQFADTGQLPPGLAMDLVQASRLPNLEETGGRLAPPVISVTNIRNEIQVTGNTFEAHVNVDGGMTGTPGQVANAMATQAMPLTFKDLGTAIQNQLTNER